MDLWATDEVHFQQHGSRCRLWVPPETRDPVLLHHPTRQSIGYFGAIRLRDGKFFFRREAETFNALTFFGFLKGLCHISLPTGRRVVMITDNTAPPVHVAFRPLSFQVARYNSRARLKGQ